MKTLRLAAILLRPSRQGLGVILLPAVAFAVVTALLGATLGGARAFWTWTIADAMLYQFLAIIALVLLAVPLFTLGGAAARLSARRRDARLASLRLLGATSGMVVALAVIEATVIALAGAIVGALGGLASGPLIGLIHFNGAPLGTAAHLPLLWAGILVIAVTLLAAISALAGMGRVIVTPLGVARRESAGRARGVVAIVGVALLIGATYVSSTFMGAAATVGFAIVVVVIGGGIAVSMLVLGLVGSWLLGVIARRQVRSASTPAHLLAARAVLESPQAAWRQVGGVALIVFVGVIAGTGASIAGLAAADPSAALLASDISTGVLITIVGAFLTVACTVGVQQAAQILDARERYQSLHRAGMDVATMDAARRRAVAMPLLVAVVGSAAAAGAVAIPLVGITLVTQPMTLVVLAVTIAAGVTLTIAGLLTTRPLLRRVAVAA
mgnify:CR=1 FL=1